MLSSDKNIETIAQLAEAAKRYLTTQTEYVKLDIIEKTVRLITLATISIVALLLVLLMLIYLSFAIAYALSSLTGLVWAFVIVASIYFLLLILFIFNRRRWIEKPLVRFLASLLLN